MEELWLTVEGAWEMVRRTVPDLSWRDDSIIGKRRKGEGGDSEWQVQEREEDVVVVSSSMRRMRGAGRTAVVMSERVSAGGGGDSELTSPTSIT